MQKNQVGRNPTAPPRPHRLPTLPPACNVAQPHRLVRDSSLRCVRNDPLTACYCGGGTRTEQRLCIDRRTLGLVHYAVIPSAARNLIPITTAYLIPLTSYHSPHTSYHLPQTSYLSLSFNH